MSKIDIPQKGLWYGKENLNGNAKGKEVAERETGKVSKGSS